jgi:hypothetical protein
MFTIDHFQTAPKPKSGCKTPLKKTGNETTKIEEHLLIYIFWIKTAFADNRYWLLIMDEYTHFQWN